MASKRPLESDVSNASLAAPVADTAPAPKKAKKTSVPTGQGFCSLNKKEFGDRIKSSLVIEKYALQPTMIKLQMDTAFFRSFFCAHGINISPSTFDDETDVVVAELNNPQAGAVFGVSKIKGGNRYSKVEVDEMVVVFHPKTKTATAWVSI